MAKPKQHLALFEVIHKDKRFSRNGGAIPTPGWFNRGKSAAGSQLPRPTLTQRLLPGRRSAPPIASPVISNEAPSAAPRPTAAGPLTFTSSAIIAAAVLVVAFAAFHFTRRAAPSQAQIALNGPAHPGVLDLGYPKAAAPIPLAATSSESPAPAPAADVRNPVRQPGLNYMLIHTYVTEKSAQQTADFLNANKIPCTVERSVPGVLPQLYALVGLDSFAHAGTPEYAQSILRIKTLIQAKAAGVPLSMHSFRPQLIKWPAHDATHDTAQAG